MMTAETVTFSGDTLIWALLLVLLVLLVLVILAVLRRL